MNDNLSDSSCKKQPNVRHYADGTASVMRKAVVYTELRFYKRSDVLYQLTQVFCQRYLPRYGDRTVDQMVQAARSTKQNIAEGSTDGRTSTETELKLLGIARGSNQELLEDYHDYLKRKGMKEWFGNNKRFDRLHHFCQEHTLWEEYRPIVARMNDEELANIVREQVVAMDKANNVCGQDSKYTKRLLRLTKGMTNADGIKLNFKVYLTRPARRRRSLMNAFFRIFTSLALSPSLPKRSAV